MRGSAPTSRGQSRDANAGATPGRRDGADPPARVVLGQVAGVHALRGEVRVHYYGDGPDNLLQVPEVWLTGGSSSESPKLVRVLAAGMGRPGEVRLLLEGVADREAAAALRGLLVEADPDLLAPLDEGEFYWHELVGCEVRGTDGREIGTVRELWETGAHDLLVVESPDGERYLLSTARELMPHVDVGARRITVEALPGLLEPVAIPGDRRRTE